MQELYESIDSVLDELDAALVDTRNSGIQLAENERTYRAELAKEILRLRADGMPVSIVGDVARGNERIAELKYLRDASEVLYKAGQEAINANKLKLRTLNEEADRVWHSGGLGGNS